MAKSKYLIEVSWEVCNKVGGINTVIKTKLKHAVKHFGDKYILIGPWLDYNDEFVEASTPVVDPLIKVLKEKGIECRGGYWDVAEKPTVILVAYKELFNISELLYDLWQEFEVDSLASNYEYYEPILFSATAAKAIASLTEQIFGAGAEVLAHFHEWLCGAGVLFLKKNTPQVSTIFTTHATVLGRSLASNNIDIYNLPENFDPDTAAKKYNVFARHSLERASAREADCFTTVSNITADEALTMLNKYPDKVVCNGLDIATLQHSKEGFEPEPIRQKLREIAGRVTGKPVPENAILWVTCGRYEFHNKGFDILLKSLANLEQELSMDFPPIIAFFLIAVHRRDKADSLLEGDIDYDYYKPALGIATHKIVNPSTDPILKLCNELHFREEGHRVHVVYSDAYIDGNDGVFDVPYDQILAACDLTLFPSYYEPWGYTPLESLAYSTPTLTSDIAGFGNWVEGLNEEYHEPVHILAYRNKTQTEVIAALSASLIKAAGFTIDQPYQAILREKASVVAKLADWKELYKDYLDAYSQALEFHQTFCAGFSEDELVCDAAHTANIREEQSETPRFRVMQFELQLPDELKALRDLAYNLWWAWHHKALNLFRNIDTELWDSLNYNPIAFLNAVSKRKVLNKLQDPEYMDFYTNTIKSLNERLQSKDSPSWCAAKEFDDKHPIAYFCLEYAMDECMPIYSGGLGVLAGDYVKAMADLNVPFVAVGLFYKEGYFNQKLSSQGEQMAEYDTLNPNQLPMHQLSDENGKPILVSVEMPYSTVYVGAWQVKVGNNNLYLLDTDVAENSPQDRRITARLYDTSSENRIKQELILGVCGVRLLEDKLNIEPTLYHLNEGHSAFLLLERTKSYFNKGFTQQESLEIVKTSSVFTTHTPVPAGNETFSEALIRKYFSKPMQLLDIPVSNLLNLGRDVGSGAAAFSMTTLAIRLSSGINAVSELHGEVARNMWHKIWSGFLQNEAPIDYVTNGVHVATWLGYALRELYGKYLGEDWPRHEVETELWNRVDLIPDNRVWDAHIEQKERLLQVVRNSIIKEYPLRGEKETLINNSLACLKSDCLIIGFARRFAAYKRPDLIFKNAERLTRVLTNSDRPVVLLIAGKAHPADGIGKDLIRSMVTYARQGNFKGHVIFLENYSMHLAKAMVQGVDVWLNNPIIYREACGTSGIKAAINGVLNLSVKDGWWAEAYNEDVGWAIETFSVQNASAAKRDEIENMFLLDVLEYSVVPMYYEKNDRGFSPKWVSKMKASIAQISCNFGTQRMVKDYFAKLYYPVIHYAKQAARNDYHALKSLTDWKKNLKTRFSTVKIKTILINGIHDGKLTADGKIKIKVLLFSGKMKAKGLRIELVLTKSNDIGDIKDPIIIPLELVDKRESGILTYILEYQLEDTGFYNYGIRIYPFNPLLLHPQDVGLVYWG